jgi:hypothetical protein
MALRAPQKETTSTMRSLALLLALSTAVAASACDRASASDEEFGAQLVQDSLSELENASAAEPTPVVRERVIVREVPAREPQTMVVEETNVKRDAAIGAGLGAAVGAIANDDNRVKGGVIGAIVGGAAGAIVGKTVDKDKKVVPRR